MTTTKRLLLVLTVVLCIAPLGFPQTPAAPAAATPAAAPAPTPKPITDADLANAPVPSADARAKGDPDGSLTGTASDITVSDPKKGLTIGDLANQVGQNKIAINFVWTLVTGFLVMFMQAGFAIVETGLCRAKNANHTMMMNFMVYGVGMLAYWLIGFTIQMGGVGAVANLGGTPPLNSEFTITLSSWCCSSFRWSLWTQRLRLSRARAVSAGNMLLSLFQRCSWLPSPIPSSPIGLGAAAGLPTWEPISVLARGIVTLRDRGWFTQSADSLPWLSR